MSKKTVVESKWFESLVIVMISLNAITLGLETMVDPQGRVFAYLHILDQGFLGFFLVELVMKMFLYRLRFFRDPWRVFDFVIVSVSLLPASGPFTVFRALRVLRALRMISAVPEMKRVVSGLLAAIPGLGAVGAIIGLIFYVSAVMATKIFGASFPAWFGSLGLSAYSLFQIMTLESWSMGIVRPVMERYPYAWTFFLPFILITTFTMLNLFIAVIVNAMQAETEDKAEIRSMQSHDERVLLLQEIAAVREQLAEISAKLKQTTASGADSTRIPNDHFTSTRPPGPF